MPPAQGTASAQPSRDGRPSGSSGQAWVRTLRHSVALLAWQQDTELAKGSERWSRHEACRKVLTTPTILLGRH
jgi:hypothetical protein